MRTVKLTLYEVGLTKERPGEMLFTKEKEHYRWVTECSSRNLNKAYTHASGASTVETP